MITHAEIIRAVQAIRCKDLEFHVEFDDTTKYEMSSLYLQVRATRVDRDEPDKPAGIVKGRKWRLSEHMTVSEIVQTAFCAALHYEEHELREAFHFREQPIFGPHFDVNDLVALAALRGTAGAREPW